MEVRLIENKELLESVEMFKIENLLWGTEKIAKTYGYIGFVPGDGLYIKLVCEEKNPLRIYKKDQDPVYKDSAMEAFFQFKGNDTAADDIYLNFEMNANGALLACYGKNKMNRIPFTPDQIRKMKCSAEIQEEQWNVNLTLPIEILEQVYGKLNLQEGSDFRCNFYKICETKEYEHYAANIISAQVIMKPNCVLGLATGSTPIGTYDQLVEWYNKGDLDFSEVTTVNLDEYKGLPRTNDQSYYYFMHQHLFDRVNIDPERTNVPNGMEPDAEKECGRYEELIRSLGGVDLQLLGLGHNGHIGFNEPGEAFEKETHCVDLTESTIEANKRFFASADDVPKQAYTMGIKTIMQAKKILIVVNGENKADIVERAFFGPVTPEVPASILQLHNDVTLVGDEAALAKIEI